MNVYSLFMLRVKAVISLTEEFPRDMATEMINEAVDTLIAWRKATKSTINNAVFREVNGECLMVKLISDGPIEIDSLLRDFPEIDTIKSLAIRCRYPVVPTTEEHIYGPESITEHFNGHDFEVSTDSFIHAYPSEMIKLYEKVQTFIPKCDECYFIGRDEDHLRAWFSDKVSCETIFINTDDIDGKIDISDKTKTKTAVLALRNPARVLGEQLHLFDHYIIISCNEKKFQKTLGFLDCDEETIRQHAMTVTTELITFASRKSD